VVVIDLNAGQDDEEPDVHFMANPEILWCSDETSTVKEGCLSVPETRADVIRPARVKVRYLNRDNEHIELDADGLMATCIQHEIDHLNGVLFIEHLSKLKQEMIRNKLKKLKKFQPL